MYHDDVQHSIPEEPTPMADSGKFKDILNTSKK